jgi:hypothetical protein
MLRQGPVEGGHAFPRTVVPENGTGGPSRHRVAMDMRMERFLSLFSWPAFFRHLSHSRFR